MCSVHTCFRFEFCNDEQVVITRFATGGYDIFLTCPAKSMHREPEGLEVHAFAGQVRYDILLTCPAKSMHREPEGLEVHAFAGQVRKISCTPVAKRV